MQSEEKICQNCKGSFTIEPDDFSFYEKIKVPPPTFCPECRMIRRLMWRNTRSLHKRSCGLCRKSLISMYADKGEAPIYCTDCWNGPGWDPLSYGKEYDFSRNFFEQLKELFVKTPRFYAYKIGNLINSEFTNFSLDNKNAYLSYSVLHSEDVMYSEIIDKSKRSLDCYAVDKLDNCSYNVDCDGNYNTHYALQSRTCIDSYFIFDCANCQHCTLSGNLRNQQYVFKNKKLTKEEYEKELKELSLETSSGFEKAKAYFDGMVRDEAIHKYAFIYNSQNATGDYIHDARNIKKCFDTKNSENIAYANRAIDSKDCMDGSGMVGELVYECMASTDNTYKNTFCYLANVGTRECEYSLILKNCSNCFACVGLINAQYCIFNKQYEKEEYEKIVSQIKEQMNAMPYTDQKGRVYRYGEFFPHDMSPFGYNETNAHDLFPITRDEATNKGYGWMTREERNYKITKKSSELPDNIKEVKNEILDEVIACPNNGDETYQCTSAFKIVPDELQFYRQKNLPLPRFCPNCRHYARLKYRNTMRLKERRCMCELANHGHAIRCENKFKTTYTSDRPEKVYCEKCYQQEVY